MVVRTAAAKRRQSESMRTKHPAVKTTFHPAPIGGRNAVERIRASLMLWPRNGDFNVDNHRGAFLDINNHFRRIRMTHDTTAAKFLEVAYRLKMNTATLADYFGVPIGTMRNWLSGTREPPPVALRLLDVLCTIETFNPVLHAALVPPARGNNGPGRPRVPTT